MLQTCRKDSRHIFFVSDADPTHAAVVEASALLAGFTYGDARPVQHLVA